MDNSAITAMFEPWRARHVRSAWKPITIDEDERALSWFGGEPTAAAGERWPVCERCSAPMRFFLQLALGELPERAGFPLRDGLLQLFYCSNDDRCDSWEPFSGTHSIRRVSAGSLTEVPPPSVDSFPKRVIAGWSEVQDYPSSEEHEALGLRYNYDFDRGYVDVHCDDPAIHLADADDDVADAIAAPATGDKLSGWPYWVQSPEYPRCPRCRESMQLLLQVDSEDNLAYMFGDVGCAHLTYCPKHPDVCAFGWACS